MKGNFHSCQNSRVPCSKKHYSFCLEEMRSCVIIHWFISNRQSSYMANSYSSYGQLDSYRLGKSIIRKLVPKISGEDICGYISKDGQCMWGYLCVMVMFLPYFGSVDPRNQVVEKQIGILNCHVAGYLRTGTNLATSPWRISHLALSQNLFSLPPVFPA